MGLVPCPLLISVRLTTAGAAPGWAGPVTIHVVAARQRAVRRRQAQGT